MPSSTNQPSAPVSPVGAVAPPARHSESSVPNKTLRMDVSSYSATKKVPNGCGIKSPRLDAGGQSWRIVFYPNGMRPGTTKSISLYLQLDTAAVDPDDGGDVEVRYQFMLPGRDQGLGFMSGKVVATFNSLLLNAHGFERFITRDDMEKSGCISNDYFNIRCDVTVLATTRRRKPPSVQEQSLAKALPSKPQHPTPPSSVVVADHSGRPGRPPLVATPPSSQLQVPSVTAVPAASGLQGSSMLKEHVSCHPREQQSMAADVVQSFLPKDLGRLLATKEGADVDFEVGGIVFAAHRCVLAARSPVFKADFFGPTMEENTSYIRVNDMNAETFEALLHYIYTDSLPDMNDHEVGAMAHHLLCAADRFELKGLKSIMENRLSARICVINALATLVLAEQHQCHKLKSACFRFIACPENDRAVMATDGAEHLAKNCPSIVRELVTKILDSRDIASNGQLKTGKEME